MKNNPLVSIIIPIYNTKKYFKTCLDSVINQTYQNLEIILVDDGSTDDSGKIADDYAKKDKRIKVIHQKNQGQSTARNVGLKKATGNYISFVDSDDELNKNFIKELLQLYQKNPKTSLTSCGFLRKYLNTKQKEILYIKPSSKKIPKESPKAYILRLLAIDGRLYSSVNKLYRADIAKTLKFDQTLNFAEDTKFVLDYLQKTNKEISFILKPLYIYNFGSENSTINKSSLKWQNWQTSYQNLKNWVGPNPTIKEKFWLKIILLRWHISYRRSKIRAKNSN